MKRFGLTITGFIILALVLFVSCGQLISDAAKDELLGNYSGTVTYKAHMSEFNLGLEDNVRKEKYSVSIREFDGLVTLNMSGFGAIRLNNITAATNGCGFNIKYSPFSRPGICHS